MESKDGVQGSSPGGAQDGVQSAGWSPGEYGVQDGKPAPQIDNCKGSNQLTKRAGGDDMQTGEEGGKGNLGDCWKQANQGAVGDVMLASHIVVAPMESEE